MKIVILDGERTNPGDLSWACIGALGELTVYGHTSPEETVERIADNEVVIVDHTQITREIIEACPSIRLITLFATGYNVIDVEAAREHGIPVCNSPAYSTNAVAQMALAHLLEIASQVGRHNRVIHDGGWKSGEDFGSTVANLTELSGKTAGIVGYGAIGRAFGRMLKAMGLNLLVWSRHPKSELEDAQTRYVDLDELYAGSDVVSIHVPLNDETRGMIDRDAIAKMKDGAILINTARGALLNEADVAEALKSGKLRALGADVVSVEPIEPTNPLLSAPNVNLTPHIGWAPKETRDRLLGIVADNIRCFLEGRPQNVVNGVR